MKQDIADIRINYSQKSFSEADALPDAIDQFSLWWNEAVASQLQEVNAMTLATADVDGIPDARIVLLKNFSNQGFSFFTNYESAKGRQLAGNPYATLVFFWKELERQVRIKGRVEKLSRAESEAYFHSRPVGSQAGAIASHQSSVIKNRKGLDEKIQEILKNTEAGKQLEIPDYWGGYIVKPAIIEFWQGRPNRLHDRLQYTLQADEHWLIERLSP